MGRKKIILGPNANVTVRPTVSVKTPRGKTGGKTVVGTRLYPGNLLGLDGIETLKRNPSVAGKRPKDPGPPRDRKQMKTKKPGLL